MMRELWLGTLLVLLTLNIVAGRGGGAVRGKHLKLLHLSLFTIKIFVGSGNNPNIGETYVICFLN